MSGFEVDGSRVGFTATLVGNTVELVRDSGDWTGTDAITYEHDGPRAFGMDDQTAWLDGALYETHAGDVLGLGVPVRPFNGS